MGRGDTIPRHACGSFEPDRLARGVSRAVPGQKNNVEYQRYPTLFICSRVYPVSIICFSLRVIERSDVKEKSRASSAFFSL